MLLAGTASAICAMLSASPGSGMLLLDQAALFQEPHTVDGYCNALWRFTCAYQPATYFGIIDRRVDPIRRVA